MNSITLEQIIQSLPETTRVWVQKHQPESLEAAVKLTEEYVEMDFPLKELRTPMTESRRKKVEGPCAAKPRKEMQGQKRNQ